MLVLKTGIYLESDASAMYQSAAIQRK